MSMEKQFSYVHGCIVYTKGFSTYNEDELKYHNSFDWIIPVAQEIYYKYPQVSEHFDKCFKENPYDMKHIYAMVVEFLDMIGYK